MKLWRANWLGAYALVLSGMASPVQADVVDMQVDASASNGQARTVRGPHFASFDPQASSQHRLIVLLNGASVEPSQAAPLQRHTLNAGYHVINLDYPHQGSPASGRI